LNDLPKLFPVTKLREIKEKEQKARVKRGLFVLHKETEKISDYWF